MRDIYIGTPTKDEIYLYLRQKEHSLLNFSKLRSEILSHRAVPTTSRPDANFFQEIFPETKGDMLREKTNQPLKFFYEGKCAAQDVPRSSTKCAEPMKINIKALRKSTHKNTQRNTGYKCVKLHYKTKQVAFGEPMQKKKGDSGRKTTVRWSPSYLLEPHNVDGAKSILKSDAGSSQETSVRKKVRVVVETKVFVPHFEFETDFKYRINK